MATGQSSYLDGEGTVYFDLTSDTGDSAEINGALFFSSQPEDSSGTGLIDAFVRVQDGGNDDSPGFENGYNTSYRPLSYEENTSPSFTKSLLLSSVPKVIIDGVEYYEFRLDINQLNSSPLLSLDALKLYTSPTSAGFAEGEIDGAWFTANATEVYDIDGAGDASILLDYSLNAGSGKSDMFFYVPVSDFNGADPETTYVTLYSEFGDTGVLDAEDNLVALDDPANSALGDDGDDTGDTPTAIYGSYLSNDGFEEWSVSKELGDDFLSGYKWDDSDGDGVWDPNETGEGGFTIEYTLTYKDGNGANAPLVSITGIVITSDGSTDANGDGVIDANDVGYYAIPVPLGAANNTQYTLTLTEYQKPDWVNTYDGDAVPNRTTTFTFDENTLTGSPEDISGDYGATEAMNFGNFQLFDVSGYKYTDFDGDGVLDPVDTGAPIAGVTIFIDMDDSGDLSAGDITTTTNGSGYWEFTDLGPNVDGKSIYEVVPAGYVQTIGTAGYTIMAASGFDQCDNYFANYELFDISGYKYTDVDGDGVIDAEDTGLGGVTIFIDVNGNDLDDDGYSTVTADGTTDANGDGVIDAADAGYWEFTDLDNTVDGALVKEITPSGYIQTLGPVGAIDASSGNDQTGFDFANFELFDISGFKWEDVDGDGSWDEGEPGKAGWTIYLDDDADPDNGTIDSEITGADGSYSFENLQPGTYYIYEDETVDGWSKTYGPTVVVVGASGVDVAGSFETTEELNFGNFQDMSISGYKWGDVDGDSTWNEPDTAVLSGWTIVLDNDDNPDNGYITTTITDVDGYYEFTGLNPVDNALIGGDADGVLHVYELQQDGFVQTYGGFSFDIESGLVIQGTVGDAVEGNFGNQMLAGANRTPGFWQSTLGQSFYNGDDTDNGDANGDGVPDGNKDFEAEGWTCTDLLFKYGIDTDGDGENDSFFVWDGNDDGEWDAGSDGEVDDGDIVLTFDELLSWVSGGEKGGGRDYLQILERDVGAAYLNTLNNHSLTSPCGEPGDPLTGMTALDPNIEDSFEDAIEFILNYDPNFDGQATGSKKEQQNDWRAGGSDAHNELSAFNENGDAFVDGALTQVAMDGDDYSSMLVQNYLATQASLVA